MSKMTSLAQKLRPGGLGQAFPSAPAAAKAAAGSLSRLIDKEKWEIGL